MSLMNSSIARFKTMAVGPASIALLLAGCRVGPKYTVPPATAQAPPAAYKESPALHPEDKEWKVADPARCNASRQVVGDLQRTRN